MVLALDGEQKNAKLSLRQTQILEALQHVVTNLCTDEPANA